MGINFGEDKLLYADHWPGELLQLSYVTVCVAISTEISGIRYHPTDFRVCFGKLVEAVGVHCRMLLEPDSPGPFLFFSWLSMNSLCPGLSVELGKDWFGPLGTDTSTQRCSMGCRPSRGALTRKVDDSPAIDDDEEVRLSI
jgi:hypothetical protein